MAGAERPSEDGVSQPSESQLLPNGKAKDLEQTVELALRDANAEFEQLAGIALKLPLEILAAQRDQALRELAQARLLLTEREEERLASRLAGETKAQTEQATDVLVTQLEERRKQLLALNSELEENRAEAIRLQGERDEAISTEEETRAQLSSDLEASRDEVASLSSQLEDSAARLETEIERFTAETESLRIHIDDIQAELSREQESALAFKRRFYLESSPAVEEQLREQVASLQAELAKLTVELAAVRSPEAPLPTNPFVQTEASESGPLPVPLVRNR